MNELIQIGYETEQPIVSARDLHDGLEINTKFSMWFSRITEFGFNEGKDFFPKMGKTSEIGGRPSIDYDITVDMAKQICMLQRTEKGRQYRQYFLDLEKAWNTPEQIFARALKLADRRIEELKDNNRVLQDRVDEMKPKEIFADAVSASHTSILIGDLAKILKQNGYETGQKRLFEQFRTEGFLIKSGSSKNMPTQKAMDLKLFEVKESSITNPDGSIKVTRTTKVTGKGQQFFINRYIGKE